MATMTTKTTATAAFNLADFNKLGAALVADTLKTCGLLAGASRKWDGFLHDTCREVTGTLLVSGKLTKEGQALRKALIALRDQIKKDYVGEKGTAETGQAMIGRIGQAWHIMVNPKATEKQTASVQTWARALGPNRVCMLDTGLAPVGAQTGRKSKVDETETAPETEPETAPVVVKGKDASSAPTYASVDADLGGALCDARVLCGTDAVAIDLLREAEGAIADLMARIAKVQKRAA